MMSCKQKASLSSRRKSIRFLSLSLDDLIRIFFNGNAIIAVVVLTLITLFLFMEGAAFFTQNQENLRLYRQAGLEYVDYIRRQEGAHSALTRYIGDIRLKALQHFRETENLSYEEASARLADFDTFANNYSDAVMPLQDLLYSLSDAATETKAYYLTLSSPPTGAEVKERTLLFINSTPEYEKVAETFSLRLQNLVAGIHFSLPTEELNQRLSRLEELNADYIRTFPDTLNSLQRWDPLEEIPFYKSISSFLFGREWVTNSFWQDWYGVVPLFTGSLLVSGIALLFAIPLGIGAAIYGSQVASAREQRIIKPSIEFISAIPSVVLGFFGIAVLGQALRALSQIPSLSWIPGFPFTERLNALTAGLLLALIAIPTIYTLAEDALNNVPRSYKEASLALGASRLQTIFRIIIPASLSGLISACLLGLGRVIGETMVVLLCAGNRIAIPDFGLGPAVITEPVHTMTGIIAQEMGEVVRGSIHYRALFVVGLLLFLIALLINYTAKAISRRYTTISS